MTRQRKAAILRAIQAIAMLAVFVAWYHTESWWCALAQAGLVVVILASFALADMERAR